MHTVVIQIVGFWDKHDITIKIAAIRAIPAKNIAGMTINAWKVTYLAFLYT